MKYFLLLLNLLLLPVLHAAAQEKGQFSAAIGFEGNNNAFKGAAFGTNIYALFGISDNVAIGAKFGASFHSYKESDEQSYTLATFEPQAMLRYWFDSFDLLGFNVTPYGQADLGVSIKRYRSVGTSSFLGGMTLGLRMPIESIYIEPYVRDGYPFMWGAGIAIGYVFK